MSKVRYLPFIEPLESLLDQQVIKRHLIKKSSLHNGLSKRHGKGAVKVR